MGRTAVMVAAEWGLATALSGLRKRAREWEPDGALWKELAAPALPIACARGVVNTVTWLIKENSWSAADLAAGVVAAAKGWSPDVAVRIMRLLAPVLHSLGGAPEGMLGEALSDMLKWAEVQPTLLDVLRELVPALRLPFVRDASSAWCTLRSAALSSNTDAMRFVCGHEEWGPALEATVLAPVDMKFNATALMLAVSGPSVDVVKPLLEFLRSEGKREDALCALDQLGRSAAEYAAFNLQLGQLEHLAEVCTRTPGYAVTVRLSWPPLTLSWPTAHLTTALYRCWLRCVTTVSSCCRASKTTVPTR
jgi:hypothetical protein